MVFNQTFTFQAIDVPNPSCPPNYKLPNVPSKTTGLYSIICLEKDMLVKICGGNHDISNGIINGAD